MPRLAIYQIRRASFYDIDVAALLQLDDVKEELAAARSRKSPVVVAVTPAKDDPADDDKASKQQEQIEGLQATVETLQTQLSVGAMIKISVYMYMYIH